MVELDHGSGGIDLLGIEEVVKASYRDITAKYRRDDEIEVTTDNHRRLSRQLRELSKSFSHPISALDAGCGTGRYFHCLENVELLVGLDISEEMLATARNPVCGNEITAKTVRLIRGNAHFVTFPPGSFHLIYSLGMFGHGCPVTVEICNRFHEWLAPGGKLFFNTPDVNGWPLFTRWRRRLRERLYPWLNNRWQHALDMRKQRSPFFDLNREQLERIVAATRFSEFSIASHACRTPLRCCSRHWECVMIKK